MMPTSLLMLLMAVHPFPAADASSAVQRVKADGVQLELGIQAVQKTAGQCHYVVEFGYATDSINETVIELTDASADPPVHIKGSSNRYRTTYIIEGGQSKTIRLSGRLKNQEVANLELALDCYDVRMINADVAVVDDQKECYCVEPNVISEDGWVLASSNCSTLCSQTGGCKYECTSYDDSGEVVGTAISRTYACNNYSPCCQDSYWSVGGDGQNATFCKFLSSTCTKDCAETTCEFSGTLEGETSPTTVTTQCSLQYFPWPINEW